MNDRSPLSLRSVLPVILLALTGCYADTSDPDVEQIGAALEMENGGLDFEDEAAAFGADAQLGAIDLLEEDPAVTDPMESNPEALAAMATPDAVRYQVAVVWGQLPGDRENDQPRDWSGLLHVNRGAAIVRRAVMFDPVT